jgi:hypothetical protein
MQIAPEAFAGMLKDLPETIAKYFRAGCGKFRSELPPDLAQETFFLFSHSCGDYWFCHLWRTHGTPPFL